MNNKKNIVILIFIILCIIISLFVVLLSVNKNNENNSNNPNENTNETPIISNTFTKLKDYDEFFSIQNLINKNGDLNTTFFAKEIYTNNDSNTRYYFISGSSLYIDMGDDTATYEKIVNYMMVVDQTNNRYELITLSNAITNIYEYANNYNPTYKRVSNGNSFTRSKTSVENILSTYLEYFKVVVVYDNEFAYNMLTDNAKNGYLDYSYFQNERFNIYNSISSKIFSYIVSDEKDEKTYSLEDNKRNKIMIYESDIMNFKIYY